MAQTLYPVGIASTLNMGQHFLSGANVIGTYIENVEVTPSVLWDGMSITDSLGNIKGLNLRIKDDVNLIVGEELVILDKRTGKRIFGGIIKECNKKFYKKDFYVQELLVQDYTRYIDLVTEGITESYDTYEYLVLRDLLLKYCPNVKYSGWYITPTDWIEIDFVDAGLRDAIQTLAEFPELEEDHRVWYVDYDGYLHYYILGEEMAPFGLSDDPDEVNTFKYSDLEYTSDLLTYETRGTLKCWEPGIFSGMTVQITNAKLGWSATEWLVAEVEAKLIAGDMFTYPVFEYIIYFGSKPKRITQRVPPGEDSPEPGGGAAEVLTKYPGSTTKNWNTGIATSGLAGDDLLTMGTAGVAIKIYKLSISTTGLQTGATINVRMYHLVNGAEKGFYDEYFTVGVDPVDLLPISGLLGDYGQIRVELHSDKVADDGKTIDWEYLVGT